MLDNWGLWRVEDRGSSHAAAAPVRVHRFIDAAEGSPGLLLDFLSIPRGIIFTVLLPDERSIEDPLH